MGKKKQQKLYRLNHKPKNQNKEEMKKIMAQLAENKLNNKIKNESLTSIIDLNLKKKLIRKEQKGDKKLKKKQQKTKEEQHYINLNEQNLKEIKQQTDIKTQPKFNLFEMTEFNSGIKTVINNKVFEQKIEEEYQLQSQAKRVMGGDLILQKFGDKPLKIIEEQQNVVLSDDEDQPNSLKNVTHPNIRIPHSNHIIDRTKQIREFRQKLPIYMKEQQIIETINNHLVTLICGQTGSGKSTQIGQFLLEKNYQSMGKIAITQPRRLATSALAMRVAQQLNTELGNEVGYQVRHQRKESEATVIKYMTDGILLNEMASDFYLHKYSVVVIDQAHQRKVNTDILIGLLSKLVLIRYQMSLQNPSIHPLRLVIMSATMRVEDFRNENLFNYFVPIVNVEARMFPVSIYFQKNTPQDYKESAVKKCVRIHKTLPDGDVLVFMTGKDEINEVAIMLEQALSNDSEKIEEQDDEIEGRAEITENFQISTHNFVIHKLYSSLPADLQQKVFEDPPANTRKFVISTNIAETSLTIPNIRYVIDCGQEKHRYFEGVWKWSKGWGSQAMAEQRAGRAGRTAHGFCYRLYSSALFANIMEKYPLPEICKQPLDSVILQLKSIGIDNVYEFPFPTPPQKEKMHSSLTSLFEIKSIEGIFTMSIDKTSITELGKILSFIPLQPRLGKLLLMGRKLNLAKHTLLIVILLTVESIFIQDNIKSKNQLIDFDVGTNTKERVIDELRKKTNTFKNKYKKYQVDDNSGDIFTSMNVLGQFFVQLFKNSNGVKNIQQRIKRESYNFELNPNTMREIYFNTDQIVEIYETLCSEKINLQIYEKPNKEDIRILLDILLDAFISNVCRIQEKNRYSSKEGKPVFINALSDLYMKGSLFVCATELYCNDRGKAYLRYPFAVRNYELMAAHGKINDPTDYAWREGQVVGLATGSIYGWQIPNLIVKDIKGNVKYFQIAKFLLEGKILKSFKSLEKYLNSPPSIIKPDNLEQKIQKIVQVMKINEIHTKNNLIQCFKKSDSFLKRELRLWLSVKNFDAVYDKIRQSILSNAQE